VRLLDEPGHAHAEDVDPRWAALSALRTDSSVGGAAAADDDTEE
jgi:hypothetical protein